MSKKQTSNKKPTANKSPLITVHRGTLQSLKDEAANADIAHRGLARISKAQQAEIEFLKSERDAAVTAREHAELDANRFKERAFSREHRIELNIGPLQIQWCGPIDTIKELKQL